MELEEEGLSVWYKDEKIYHDFKRHLHHIYFTKKAEEQLSKKYEWKTGEFKKVDWRANKRAMGMLSNPTRTWIAKYCAKFLPIGRNMQRNGYWSKSHCPRCLLCEETHLHLLECQHTKSQEKLIEGIGKLRDWMSMMLTPAQVENQIISKIQEQLHLPHVKYIVLHPVMIDQLTIGDWSHFMEGRIHSGFRQLLDRHYNTLKKEKTGEMWVSGIIQRMWSLLHRPVWEIRNNCVHRKNNTFHQTREREDLQTRVQELYASNTPGEFLSQDHHLFDTKLDSLLKSSNMALKAWIYAIGTAQQARDRAQEVDREDALQTLHKWFIPAEPILARRSTRTPPKKKRVSTKVRKQLNKTYIVIKGKKRVRSKKRKQFAASFIRTRRPSKIASSSRNERVDKEFLRRTGSFRPP